MMKTETVDQQPQNCIRALILALCVLLAETIAAGDPSQYEHKTLLNAFEFNRSLFLNHSANPVSIRNHSPSHVKAFFLSMAVPGMGEFYSGSKKMGAFFLGTETALWIGYAALQLQGKWKKQDYRLFAAAHAGADPSGKGHQYFVDLENYTGIVEYNDAKLRQRSPDLMYPEDQKYYWKWDSESSQKRFEKMRLSSDKAYNTSLLVIGGLVVNRLVSGIDAIRVAKKKDKLNVQVGISNSGNRVIMVSMYRCF